ncbi:MAG: lamin tail domain-containing protein [Bacteroidota bacterium]
MKQIRILFLITTLVTIGIIMSCGDDDTGTIDLSADLEIAFSGMSVTLAEGTTGTATISFPALLADAVFTVNVSVTATAGTDYTTEPAVSDGAVTVSVAEGATSATVDFTIVSDEVEEEDETVVLTLVEAEGFTLGTNSTFTVTITDVIVFDNIADVRGLENGAAVKIKGVATTPNFGFNETEIYVQDATGGIFVFYDDVANTIARGDEVIVEGTFFNDDTRFSRFGVAPSSDIMVTGETVTFPTETTITASDLNVTNANVGSLVSLADVVLDLSNWPTEAISSSSGVTISATVGETSLDVRIDRGESFYDGSSLPTNPVTLKGVLTRFDETIQIMPWVDGDVVDGTPGTLTVTESLVDFGEVANGASSTEQSFTVEGSGIVGDLTITASANFEVSSMSGSDFGASVVLADVSSTQTVFVRFTPTSGANIAISGTIELSALNIQAQSIDVSGTETGNGAISAPTDLFFSEYVEGSSNNKYLEIYNGTGASIDLSDYELHRYGNGASDPATYALAGTIADGTVIVIANSGATIYSGTIYDETDVNGATFYNGDDAVALFKVSTSSLIDIIGQIGCDPGSNWTDGDHSTAEKTLVRKPTVNAGVSQNPTGTCSPTSFETMTTEWDVFDQNDVSDLGMHTFGN